MAEFDHGIKIIASTTGRQLARVAGLECSSWQPLESTLPTTVELIGDRVFRAGQGRDRFVVYFEFYTYWQNDAPWDMLAKSSLLSQREKLPTVCLAFVLRPRGFRPQGGTFRLEAAGRSTQQLWFQEICLWQLDPEEWWENVPGLMALYPLCRHRRTPHDAVRHAAETISRIVEPEGERADQLFLLDVFGELAYPRIDIERIIGSAAMLDTKLGRRLWRKGATERLQTDILKLLRSQFGPAVADELAPTVIGVDDIDLLDNTFDLALAGTSLDRLRAALKRAGKAPPAKGK